MHRSDREVAAGAWARGSSEIQLASGCLTKAVIQMKTDSLRMMLSFATTCSQHIVVGTLSAGYSHNDSVLHADCYVSSVICVVLMLLMFIDRSVLDYDVLGIHSQYI